MIARSSARRLMLIWTIAIVVTTSLTWWAVSIDSPAVGASPVAASSTPDRIVLNPTTTPSTSQTVTWRTDEATTTGAAEFGEVDGPTRRVEASSITVEPGRGVATARHHSVVLDGLDPATTYTYRVGDAESWSDWYQFTTPGDGSEPWSFLYFGDAQLGLDNEWPTTVNAAYEKYPDARISVHAGDLVNDGDDDAQWAQWFAGIGSYAATSSVVAATGNHELYGDPDLDAFHATFENPRNGPSGYGEEVWFADYGGVRFISLNGNNAGGTGEQGRWLEQVLSTNPMPWTVVTFHQPMFSAREDRNNTAIRLAWLPLFERYGVDLVLQGHDHAYVRGHLAANETAEGVMGPVYVVANAGGKYYDLDPSPKNNWTLNEAVRAVTADKVTTWQGITVESDRLVYRSYAAAFGEDPTPADLEPGDLVDAFTVSRQADGSTLVTDDRP